MRRYDRVIDISKMRDRVIVWNAIGERNFTEDDIPDWVREQRPSLFERGRRGEMGEVYWYLIKVKHNRVCMFEVDGVVHFNLDGYKKIIDYAERREYIRQDYIDRWREEVFGKT